MAREVHLTRVAAPAPCPGEDMPRAHMPGRLLLAIQWPAAGDCQQTLPVCDMEDEDTDHEDHQLGGEAAQVGQPPVVPIAPGLARKRAVPESESIEWEGKLPKVCRDVPPPVQQQHHQTSSSSSNQQPAEEVEAPILLAAEGFKRARRKISVEFAHWIIETSLAMNPHGPQPTQFYKDLAQIAVEKGFMQSTSSITPLGIRNVVRHWVCMGPCSAEPHPS